MCCRSRAVHPSVSLIPSPVRTHGLILDVERSPDLKRCSLLVKTVTVLGHFWKSALELGKIAETIKNSNGEAPHSQKWRCRASDFTQNGVDLAFQVPEPEQTVVTVGGRCAAGSCFRSFALRSAVALKTLKI